MANIIHFVPRAERECRKNLEDFIALCKGKLTVFGEDLEWKEWKWPGVVSFTKIGVNPRSAKLKDLLDKEIMNFAKSYIRYQQGHNPTKNIQEIKAVRCIEQALLNVYGVADITKVDRIVLDEAANVAKTGYQGAAYSAGVQIVKLANFLFDYGLIDTALNWKNPIQRKKDNIGIGEEAEKARTKNLPAKFHIECMGKIFYSKPNQARDIFTSSLFALGLCAPSRVSEIQDLSVDCLFEEQDSQGVSRSGFRFYSAKGYGANKKWILESFTPVAEEAISRMVSLSEEGRKLAKWYERNPDKFYRHEKCPDVGEDDPLDAKQICLAMGWNFKQGKEKSVAFNPSKKWILKILKEKNEITLRDINSYIHTKLPKGWPWKNKAMNLKYSDCITCFRKDELHLTRGVSPVFLYFPNNSVFTFDLGERETKDHTSIWARYGFTNPDGSAINMRSHMLRHLLNTAAKMGELGEIDLAMWSGRANVHQNESYNHVTDEQMLEKAIDIGGTELIESPLEKIEQNKPVQFKDFGIDRDGIALVTEIGFCMHDTSMQLCPRHMDCINCSDLVCVKGDKKRYEQLLNAQECVEKEYKKSKKAQEAEVYGADRWTAHQRVTLDRFNGLIQIFEDDNVLEGAIIRRKIDDEFDVLTREWSALENSPNQKLIDNDGNRDG